MHGNERNDRSNQLLEAARCGDVPEVSRLIASGANPNVETAYRYNPEVSANVGNQPALLLAAWTGKYELVRLLLDAGANVNRNDGTGETALSAAACRGDRDLIGLLLDRGACINSISMDGTPLRAAATSGNAGAVTLLIERGATVNEDRPFGETALTAAIRNGHTEVAELLRAYGATSTTRAK